MCVVTTHHDWQWLQLANEYLLFFFFVAAGSMKTNIPFQAPGISASPRGPGQEQGTNPKQVFKNIGKTIKEQNCERAHVVQVDLAVAQAVTT
jgi:hypothetical protein